ncbi:hypothetical protein SANTM175S_01355 [Streptomyces antimycoticus]
MLSVGLRERVHWWVTAVIFAFCGTLRITQPVALPPGWRIMARSMDSPAVGPPGLPGYTFPAESTAFVPGSPGSS